jgi:hypothetical protein
MERRVQELSAAIESHHRGAGRGASRGRGTYRAAQYHPYSTRTQPYVPPGRNGLYRNRTLVINNPSDTTSNPANDEDESKPNDNGPVSSDVWISKRDRSYQLINKAVYDKRSEAPANSQGMHHLLTFGVGANTLPDSPSSALKRGPFRYRKSLGS